VSLFRSVLRRGKGPLHQGTPPLLDRFPLSNGFRFQFQKGRGIRGRRQGAEILERGFQSNANRFEVPVNM
jgi:hypothetical protein